MALVQGFDKYTDSASLENAIGFLVTQVTRRMHTCTMVRVSAVHPGDNGVVGTVDVTPLINQRTVTGESIPHTTVYGLPYIRVQGGASALIIDPVIGDLGVCLFAERDISAFKASLDAGAPPTLRAYDMADGIYLGGWNASTAPVQSVTVNAEGVTLEAGPEGTLTENAANAITTISSLWTQILNGLIVGASTIEFTVPEFTLIGNLPVTGIGHCTWEGNLIDVKYGGTGADLSLTGGPNNVVTQLTPGAPFTVTPIGELSPTVEYTNLSPTPDTLGGIPAGSTFASQTMTQMWNALLYPYQYPAFSGFSISTQTNPLEVGQFNLTNPTFTWTLANPGNVDPSSVNIHDLTASITLATGISNTPPHNVTYASFTKTIATSEHYQISAENTQSTEFYGDYFINWEWRVYYGDSASTALSSSDVVALGGNLQAGFAGTYAFPAAASEYKIFTCPTSMGTPSSFVDTGTGFAVPFNAPYVVAVTNAYGVTTNYNVFQSTYQLGGALNIAIS